MSLSKPQERHVKELIQEASEECAVRSDMKSLTGEVKELKEVFIDFKAKVETSAVLAWSMFKVVGGLTGAGTVVGVALRMVGKI